MPAISDPEIESAFKDLLAASWNELPDSLVAEAKKAVSKATDDKAGQEALKMYFVQLTRVKNLVEPWLP